MRDRIAAQFLTAHGLETVTVRRRSAGDVFADTTDVPALRRASTKQEHAVGGGGALAGTDTVFHLHAAALSDVPPRARDVILDASGVSYTIERVDVQTFGTRFRCDCVRKR